MVLKRKIMDRLIRWKNDPDRRCLLLQGARQVGKTYIVDQFAREQYEHYVSINFEYDARYRDLFDGDNNVDALVERMKLSIPGSRFVPGKTLLFLDEIQSCPNARTALKFFALDGRYDVIASGSLLGINYEEVSSFPAGYVDRETMYSLDFEEFLWAMGQDSSTIAYLRGLYDRREQVPAAVNDSMMDNLRQYIAVGGMPRVVQSFADDHDYDRVLRIQRALLDDYRDDIAKYAEGREKAKARACFDSIPKQLAKDSKRFTYGLVEKGSGARKYAGSLQWLYDAGIINFCHCLNNPELPFEGNADNAKFKVYMRDTGLLMAMLEDGAQRDVIVGKNLGIYKGAIYENIIGDMFAKQGKRLYYFEKNSRLEMDFFIRYEDVATAVEVKASANRQAKSMRSLIDNYGVKRGIKLSPGNVGSAGDAVEVMPLWMAMFL
ncbi:ATP/GTP-binding protein [Bifidobacterium lemurum]|uniref:ATP/GTP-binding protein n=1 Tax=Bifidobacterium lemurum TaxID=1603886 RepID=A0A261FRV5_9BIFI|nr:AAA family ATPase [Bifidobacterium lemurum]OZG61924.1 ATP/GTP-binding protein [Bifidobacterium lemurum]QOL35294.1 ATP-binding protein [Bifidobacterium lemurum]